VGVQYGVHTGDPGRYQLQAKFRRCVDENPLAGVVLDDGRSSGPAIAWIAGRTNPAITADDRNTERRARPEHGETHRLDGLHL